MRAGKMGRECFALTAGAGIFFAAIFAATGLSLERPAGLLTFAELPFLFVNFATCTLLQSYLPDSKAKEQ
jgi:hypothetical protein